MNSLGTQNYNTINSAHNTDYDNTVSPYPPTVTMYLKILYFSVNNEFVTTVHVVMQWH
jgi:hypothetical protein